MVRGRLLLVASDRRSRDRLQNVFISRGWEVAMAATEAEGVGLLNEYDPNWLILDGRLPDGNGETLLGQLQARRSRTRVVLLGPAYGEDGLRSFRPDFVLPLTLNPEEIYRLCTGTAVFSRRIV